jgi:hypothetical protein
MLITKNNRTILAVVTGTPATSVNYPFTEITDLANAGLKFQSIESFNSTQLTFAANGGPVITAGEAAACRVTLVGRNGERLLTDYPVQSLNRAVNGGFHTLLDNLELDLTKCFVTFGDVTGIAANDVVAFSFSYSK